MKVSIIVAWAKGQVIGADNQLPWHLPEDLKHFKTVTMGKPMSMGRKTFDSIGRPLPGRTSIVITRRHQWAPKDVVVCHSVAEALASAAGYLGADSDEVMVIGGADIYRQLLPQVHKIYLTEVETEVAGDAVFPELDWSHWRAEELTRGCSEKSGLYYSFKTLVRV
jgi:dihydrofolate reductase